MKFNARTNSKRQLDVNWDLINTYLSKWKSGTELVVEITRKVSRKSDPMRKYYFSAVLPVFAEGLGYDPDEYLLFHEQLKKVFFTSQPNLLKKHGLEPVYIDKKGVYRNVPHVFADKSVLPVKVKVKFVEWVQRKAAMEGIYIEDPKS